MLAFIGELVRISNFLIAFYIVGVTDGRGNIKKLRVSRRSSRSRVPLKKKKKVLLPRSFFLERVHISFRESERIQGDLKALV